MERSFGTRSLTKPQGMLREVHWPSMASMDSRTGDGRLLKSGGANSRELPQTFKFDHEGLTPVGRVDQIILHDDGNIEGWGWLADVPKAHEAAFAIDTKMLRHNSIELADIKADIEIDWDTMEVLIDFTEWSFAGTALVSRPAFKDATVELTEELVASWRDADTPLEITAGFEVNVELKLPEMVASAATTVPFADFHIPESAEPHKIVIDEEGRVYGHLAQWNEPHRSYVDQLRYCPRPRDGYTSFNHAGPLTEKGQVGTGPIFAVGGHSKRSIRGLSREEIAEAYGGIENAWADVRVSEGAHGPWVSGRLRPGLSDETIYAVRASHISGHWVGDELLAIVSCNVPGFNPGAGFATVEDGRVVELVASFASPPEPNETVTVPATMSINGSTFTFTPQVETFGPIVDWTKLASHLVNHKPDGSLETGVTATDDEVSLARKRLALEMAVDDD